MHKSIPFGHDIIEVTKKEVLALAQDVLCEVNNCTYWGQGNKCNADAIYVVSNTTEASTSEETDCKTFKPEH
jgi:hypothetical protein